MVSVIAAWSEMSVSTHRHHMPTNNVHIQSAARTKNSPVNNTTAIEKRLTTSHTHPNRTIWPPAVRNCHTQHPSRRPPLHSSRTRATISSAALSPTSHLVVNGSFTRSTSDPIGPLIARIARTQLVRVQQCARTDILQRPQLVVDHFCVAVRRAVGYDVHVVVAAVDCCVAQPMCAVEE